MTALRRSIAAAAPFRLLLAGLWLLPAPWLAEHLFPPLNHDVAMLLKAAERWLDGERLYVEIVDVNPPLIIWLSALPNLASRLVPAVPAAAWLGAMVIAAIVAGAAATRAVLVRAAAPGREREAELAAVAALLILALLPGHDFGQREHLVLCGLFPYLALAGARLRDRAVPRAWMVAIAVAAALACATKPYYLLAPAAVEAVVLARRGWGRAAADPVPWTIGATVAGCAAAVLALAPAYVAFALPFALALYEPLRRTWGEVIAVAGLVPIIVAWAGLAAGAVLARRGELLVPAAAAGAAILIVLVQGMGWSYHVMPAVALLLWQGAGLALGLAGAGRQRAAAGVAALAALAWLLPVGVGRPFSPATQEANALAARLGAIMAAHDEADAVLVLSARIWPFYPAMNYADRRMAMRFFSLWPLAGAYRTCPPAGTPFRAPADMAAEERFVFDSVPADFATHRPALVLVQTDYRLRACDNRRFDFLAYFRRHPLFERTFRGYVPAGTLGSIAVYRRVPAAERRAAAWP